MDKRAASATSSIVVLLLVIGSLIVANVLFYTFNVGRWDVTYNRAFSLSDGSKRVVQDLDDRMDIVAYFSSDLPAQFADTERQVRDILLEYEAYSNGSIRVQMIDPSEDEDLAEQAEEDGVRRVQHQALDRDRISVVEGYRGLVIKYLGESKALPVIQDTSGLEYDITMAIKELIGDTTTIGILGGHEGPNLTKGLTGLRDALPTYELEEVEANADLTETVGEGDEEELKYAAVLVVAPETELSETELRYLDRYVMNGGSLGVFGGGVKLNIEGQEPTAETFDPGLNPLLRNWGVEVASNIVYDFPNCSRAPMRGPLGLQVAVPYPPVPIVNTTEEAQEHSVLFRIPSVTMPFTSSLGLTSAPEGVNVQVLAASSGNSWTESGAGINLRPRQLREWRITGERGENELMVAIEGTLPSAFAAVSSESGEDIDTPAESVRESRVLVAGTAAFLRDEFLPPPGPDGQRDLSSAMSLALNAVDWLAAESDLLAIRAKDIELPRIDTPPTEIQEAEDEALAAQEQAQEAANQGDREGAEEAVAEVEEALEEREALLEEWEDAKASRALKHKLWNTFGLPLILIIFGVVRWQMRQQKRANLKL